MKDPLVHSEVIENIVTVSSELGFVRWSMLPCKRPEGNIEYLIYLANYETDLVVRVLT